MFRKNVGNDPNSRNFIKVVVELYYAVVKRVHFWQFAKKNCVFCLHIYLDRHIEVLFSSPHCKATIEYICVSLGN